MKKTKLQGVENEDSKKILENKRFTGKEISEIETKFRTLFESALDAIFVMEGEKFTDCNQATLKIFGCSSHTDIIDRTPFEFSPEKQPDGRLSDEKATELIQRALNGENLRFYWKHTRKDGTCFDAEVTLNRFKTGKKYYLLAIVRDIDEISGIKEKLKLTEERYKQISEVVNEYIFYSKVEKDGNLELVWAVGSFEQITGYTVEEYKAAGGWKASLHPDDVEKDRNDFRRLLNNEKVITELRTITKTGNTVWVTVYALPVVNENNKLVGIYGAVEDISIRKTSEILLKQSEARYRRLHETMTDCFVETTMTGEIVDFNASFLKMLGYTGEEMKKLRYQDFTPGNWHEFEENIVNTQILPKGYSEVYEKEYIRKDGTIFPVELRTYLLLDDNGVPSGMWAIVRDITERKKAEKVIQQSEENFKRSIAESPFGIRIVTPEGKTVYVNKAFLDIQGYDSIDEFNKTPSVKRYTSESFAEHLARKEKRKTGNDVIDYEISIIRKDGEVRDMKVHRKEILWNSSKHFQVIYQDITEQNKLTRELIAAKEKAEESNRLKTAFLQNVSHEIRTPMNAILGFIELLKKPDLLQEERENFIGIIEESGQRLLSTINDIIEISRIETGLVETNLKTENLFEIINHNINLLRPMAVKKGLEFKLNCVEDKNLCQIETDRNKFESIITNLLSNAIKFTKSGLIETGCFVQGNYLVVYVKDTGTGIPADRLEAVFEPFYQADIQLTREHEGSGLGLAISKAYAEMLKGKIWVESEVGKGSTFFFSMPYKKSKTIATTSDISESDQPANNVFTPSEIIIADDHLASFQYLKTLLTPLGFTCLHAANGREVLQILERKANISLILIDIKMPVMDGLETVRKIREKDKTLPVIAQTAYAFPSDREKALESGCNDYISKPVVKDELLKKIGKYLSKQHILQEAEQSSENHFTT